MKKNVEKGIYALQLFKNRKLNVVIIDDCVVCKDEVPIWMDNSSLWVYLIQKARAKLCGTYTDYFEMK